MLNYESMIIRQRKWMFYLLAILVLGAGFSPYPRIFNGLLLGSAASFYNLWLLQKKSEHLGEAVERGGSRVGIGTFSRMAAAALAVLLALQFAEYFHIIAVIVGLAMSYIVMMADIFYRLFLGKNREDEDA
ncbi:ATP synthase subunit I [Lentibacillus sediminis]|uniref:ATP synthase subunit I n=1 Tax=Lentibacillus sediminis TaxID=1940529 RepID=UPI000C1C5EB8|nr:ATP synthase subunit I [Lentibacillus sediminis]